MTSTTKKQWIDEEKEATFAPQERQISLPQREEKLKS